MNIKLKQNICKFLSVVAWGLLAGSLLLGILSVVFNSKALMLASAIILAVVILVYSAHNVIRSEAFKKLRVFLIIILCTVSAMICFSVALVNFSSSENLWKEIDVLKEQKSEYEYGTDEYKQIDNKIELKREQSFGKSSQARLFSIIAGGFFVAEGFITIKKKKDGTED